MRREEKHERAVVRAEERVMDRKQQTEPKLEQEKNGRKRIKRGLYLEGRSFKEIEKDKYGALSPACFQDIQFLTHVFLDSSESSC